MFGWPGMNEFLIIILVIIILSVTGLWPVVIRGLRELRGDRTEAPAGNSRSPGVDDDLCFRMLGLTASASWDEIEHAFREKAKLHHPDRGGDEDTMRALNEAYTRLKELRRKR